MVAFWHIPYIRKQTNFLTAMTTALFSQKNVCAALGFAMAITIVLKAKAESSLVKHTARFETTKPTPQIGFESHTGPEIHQVHLYKSEKSQNPGTC
ncbi:hypothetical protein DDT91_02255 [Algoriphagus sp. AK58]|nr:hypothetical protein [Algoriphagus sp. AK58]